LADICPVKAGQFSKSFLREASLFADYRDVQANALKYIVVTHTGNY
jgi:hypothetical protein